MKKIYGTGVLCIKDQHILLGLRNSGPFTGTWSLPGGKREADETSEEAAVRELEEETGLLAHGELELISTSEEVDESKNFHCHTTGFLLKDFQGELTNKEPDKFSRWEWFAQNALPSPLFPPTESVLKAYFSRNYKSA